MLLLRLLLRILLRILRGLLIRILLGFVLSWVLEFRVRFWETPTEMKENAIKKRIIRACTSLCERYVIGFCRYRNTRLVTELKIF